MLSSESLAGTPDSGGAVCGARRGRKVHSGCGSLKEGGLDKVRRWGLRREAACGPLVSEGQRRRMRVWKRGESLPKIAQGKDDCLWVGLGQTSALPPYRSTGRPFRSLTMGIFLSRALIKYLML